MTVKLLLLKSGENVMTDIQELSVEGRTVGYLLDRPYIVNLGKSEVASEDNAMSQVPITFYPYLPLSDDKEIPIPSDWVVTIVEPIGQVKEMYEERINQVTKDGEQSD